MVLCLPAKERLGLKAYASSNLADSAFPPSHMKKVKLLKVFSETVMSPEDDYAYIERYFISKVSEWKEISDDDFFKLKDWLRHKQYQNKIKNKTEESLMLVVDDSTVRVDDVFDEMIAEENKRREEWQNNRKNKKNWMRKRN